MKDHKTIKDGFTWVPIDKRRSQFGGPAPPRTPETRLPILWLARDGGELYLVNNSKEPLEFVTASSGGFQTVDDDVVSVSSSNHYEYKNVMPNEAVKVEEYDGYYDLDYILGVYIKVQSPQLGCLEIASPSAKGGIGETVLLWDSGEAAKNVSIKTCEPL
ncbi:hypothetical protein [Paraferrimonas haliotis]|uniref:Uncharacterized protein n=1 Tax=Paraferrimonas haliotis TaxID=2013866 RepID=A0AA37TSI6_9GAMM|nr:hypothetical protein [Paraferrimonas haliotis]GLS84690.1 hypothetical protein GCM10007894_26670 [Paraferrimonas haliotis]